MYHGKNYSKFKNQTRQKLYNIKLCSEWVLITANFLMENRSISLIYI